MAGGASYSLCVGDDAPWLLDTGRAAERKGTYVVMSISTHGEMVLKDLFAYINRNDVTSLVRELSVGLTLCCVVACLFLRRRRLTVLQLMALVAVLALGFLALPVRTWELELTSRWPFRVAFHSIRPGMTVKEVRGRMAGYMEEPGYGSFGKVDESIDLRLMSLVGDVGDIPTAAKALVIAADVRGVLHLRIFDDDGRIAVDTDESRLTAQAGPIADLKKRLENLWPPHQPGEKEKHQAITAVTRTSPISAA